MSYWWFYFDKKLVVLLIIFYTVKKDDAVDVKKNFLIKYIIQKIFRLKKHRNPMILPAMQNKQ